MKIIWDGVFTNYSSIGIVSSRFVENLLKLGHEVYVKPWEGSDADSIPRGSQIYQGETADVTIRRCDPFSAWLSSDLVEEGKSRVHLPMLYFDHGMLPDDVLEQINQLPYLLAVSDFTRNMLIQCGVTSNIYVTPFGYDDRECRQINIHNKDKNRLVLVYAGYLGSFRKGLDLLLEAFRPFWDDDRVHLIIKTDEPDFETPSNIEVVPGIVSRTELYELLAKAHYFIAPARMESFGIVGLEAAAVGTSMIYPVNSAYVCYGAAIPNSHMLTSGAWKTNDENTEWYWEVSPQEITTMIDYLIGSKLYRYDPGQVQKYAQNFTWRKMTINLCEKLQLILDRLKEEE